jgi:hypothetical protein
MRSWKWTGLLLGVTSLVCWLIFAALTYDAVRDQTKPMSALIALPIFGIITPIAALVIGWKPKNRSFWRHLRSLEGGAAIALALGQSVSAYTSVVGLFEPRAATTADTDRIGAQVAKVDKKLDGVAAMLRNRFPEDPPVLKSIVGRWGEPRPRCGLVYAFTIISEGEDAALVAEIVKRPKGVEPFRLLAVITRAEGNRLWATGLEPDRAFGKAAEFRVNPTTGRLVWDDKSSAAAVEEYVRCPAS